MGIGKVLGGLGSALMGPVPQLLAGKGVNDIARSGGFGLPGLALAKKKKKPAPAAAAAGAPPESTTSTSTTTPMKKGGKAKTKKYAVGGMPTGPGGPPPGMGPPMGRGFMGAPPAGGPPPGMGGPPPGGPPGAGRGPMGPPPGSPPGGPSLAGPPPGGPPPVMPPQTPPGMKCGGTVKGMRRGGKTFAAGGSTKFISSPVVQDTSKMDRSADNKANAAREKRLAARSAPAAKPRNSAKALSTNLPTKSKSDGTSLKGLKTPRYATTASEKPKAPASPPKGLKTPRYATSASDRPNSGSENYPQRITLKPAAPEPKKPKSEGPISKGLRLSRNATPGYAKGGKIDGCAKRGKTRCKTR